MWSTAVPERSALVPPPTPSGRPSSPEVRSPLAAARLAAGLSVSELARAVHVSRPTVSAWERSGRSVPRHHWPALAAALGRSPDRLGELFAGRAPTRLDAVLVPSLGDARRAAGITQRDLAACLGVAVTTLAMWEAARTRAPLHAVDEVARLLSSDPARLAAPRRDREPDPRPLRRFRTAAGMTRVEAAALLGLAPVTLTRYEAGQRPVPVRVVRRMAGIYGRRVEEVLAHSGCRLLPLPPGRTWRPEEVGPAVRALRIAAGLSRVGLGRLVGRSGQAVASWEGGHRRPGAAVCRQLEAVFGLPPGRFPR